MDGRVKTLHPKVHGGLLGRRGTDDAVMAELGIAPIDLLVLNLYPFEATVAKPDCTLEQAIENIDIGGPAMLRSAAKNWNDVGVLTDPAQYDEALAEIEQHGGLSRATRFKLSVAAFNNVANYDGAISDFLSGVQLDEAQDGDRRPRGVPGPGQQPLRQADGPALRREPAPAGRVLPRPVSGAGHARPRSGSCRARSCRSTTSPTPMPRGNACAPSPSRPA